MVRWIVFPWFEVDEFCSHFLCTYIFFLLQNDVHAWLYKHKWTQHHCQSVNLIWISGNRNVPSKNIISYTGIWNVLNAVCLFLQQRQRAATTQSQGDTAAIKTKLLPTVFKWEGGGKDVYITGTFNNWTTKIPLVKRFDDYLSKGLSHQFLGLGPVPLKLLELPLFLASQTFCSFWSWLIWINIYTW